MADFEREILRILFFSLIAGCAGQRAVIKEESELCSCDSLMQRFPEKTRPYVKDGCYEIGNKMIYKIEGRCYGIIRDTIGRVGCGKKSWIEYWK